MNIFISSIFNVLSFRNAWWRRVETPRDLVHHLSVPDGQGVGDEDLYQLRTQTRRQDCWGHCFILRLKEDDLEVHHTKLTVFFSVEDCLHLYILMNLLAVPYPARW